jgi:hypothetical protein
LPRYTRARGLPAIRNNRRLRQKED